MTWTGIRLKTHQISVKESWNPETGWTWKVYTYMDDELNEMLAFLRDLDERHVTYVHGVEHTEVDGTSCKHREGMV